MRSDYCYLPSIVICRSVSRSFTWWALQKRLKRSRCRLRRRLVGPGRHLLHILDRFGRILYCVHSTQYSLLVSVLFQRPHMWNKLFYLLHSIRLVDGDWLPLTDWYYRYALRYYTILICYGRRETFGGKVLVRSLQPKGRLWIDSNGKNGNYTSRRGSVWLVVNFGRSVGLIIAESWRPHVARR